jgi:hypothetical protein
MEGLVERELTFSLHVAAADWITWQSDYEFEGDPRHLPMLVDENRFRRFVYTYRPFRQRTTTQEALNFAGYLRATNDLTIAVRDASGTALEALATQMAVHFPAFGTPRSALSKIAMFSAPEIFPPWDQFARCGAAYRLSRDHQGYYPIGYADYLADVDAIARSGLYEKIRQMVSRGGSTVPTGHPGFERRVLDSYLMTYGGWREAYW